MGSWENQIKEIKERVNIVDIISNYVNLKKSGENFVGLCPFHNEKTPSFTVSEKKGVFHCFGCGVGGDVISFLTRIRNESFNDTIRYLANIAGVQLDETTSDKKKANYYSINELLANHYHSLLFSDPAGKKAFNYLTVERGLSTKTINDYMIGYAPNKWDQVETFLRAHNIPLSMASDIGLIVKKQNSNEYFDRFRGRIMFPIKDYRGKVIAFGGRQFDGEQPKYMNSPDSDIYKKGMTLYGIDVAKQNMDKKGFAIFVEGYMDVLLLHQHGFKNAVATTGTAVSLYHVNTVSRYTDSVVFIFDGDEAGEKAALRTLEVIIEADIDARFALLPRGYDPDTFIIKYGVDALNKLIADAQPLFDYYVKSLIKDKENSVTGRLKAINNIILLLKKIQSSPIKQELYIKRLSELTGISNLSIKKALNSRNTSQYKSITHTSSFNKGDQDKTELIVLTIIIDHPEKMHILLDEHGLDWFENKDIVAIIKRIKELNEAGIRDVKDVIFQHISDEREKAILSAAMLNDLSGENIDMLYDYTINKLKKSYYVKEQRRLSAEIEELKTSGEEEKAYTLLKKKKEIAVFHKQ
ncbi:MAG: DNA primase [bacterium]